MGILVEHGVAMTQWMIKNSFVGGEISPSLWGRTENAKFQQGASTMRNMFGSYRGGASSRAGTAWVGQALQPFGIPPRPITFQFSINQGFLLDFGDHLIARTVTGAADNGAGLIRLAITSTVGMLTGNTMIVSGVTGTTEANGTWVITVIDGTHVDLQTSAFTNNYISGGATVTSAGYMRVISNGAYIIESPESISGITQANPAVFNIPSHGYLAGDWIYIQGVVGMTNFNNLTWIVVSVPDANHVTVTDLFGNPVSSATFPAYVSGGTSSRIYTTASPYAAVDLPYLKQTQSANTMSLACVNQETGTEYPPYDLTRVSDTDWVFNQVTFAATITAPTGISVTAHNSTTPSTWYSYTVTAVDADTGEESIAGTPAQIENNNISVNAGSNAISWSAVTGAGSYNVYAATPQFGAMVPAGVLYGYIGTSIGTDFVDSNILADFTEVPPVHNDPFVGAGNQPGDVAYYQQRRFYAYTNDDPDTYWASKPGLYTNFDSSIPVNDADSFSGAPWAQQINGIQAMVPMNPGLIILTGLGAWLLTGGSQTAITASSQTATAQAYNGCNSHILPIVINLDILYVQAKGSIVRDLSYNFFQNIFTGTDLTILSNHLFAYRQLQQWAYAEEPFKLAWAVRDDGIMLSLTYLKEQDVYTWTRHDTNGFFVGVASVTEPPVDAIYVVVQRFVEGAWRYYYERMDNRNWINVEDCFCVDSGLSYPMSFPNATLQASSAEGTSNITSVNLIDGGSGYTAPVVTAIDATGAGTGATFSVTLTSGKITAITPITRGQNYTPGLTSLVITDLTGTGAKAQPVVTNFVNFNASAAVFNSGMIGDVIRIGNNNSPVSGTEVTTTGGGKAVITSFISSTEVLANIIEPITAIILNDPNDTPVPCVSGQWSISTPTDVVTGLNHLEGLEVAILADGSVVPNQTVQNGTVVLPQAYSAITVGLPFIAQLQTLYLEMPGRSTIQGKRKDISSAVIRVEASRGFAVGTNQPDASTQPNFATVPWTNMQEIKERNALVHAGNSIPLATDDFFVHVDGGWDTRGQVAIQQTYPLPLNVLAVIPQTNVGDSSE